MGTYEKIHQLIKFNFSVILELSVVLKLQNMQWIFVENKGGQKIFQYKKKNDWVIVFCHNATTNFNMIHLDFM